MQKMPVLQRFLQRLPRKGRERLLKRLLVRLGEVDAQVCGYSTSLDLRDYVQRCVYLDCFEYPDQVCCRNVVSSGDVTVDIGANCGGYLALFSSIVGEKGKVIAFEPNPRLVGRLDKLLKRNSMPQVDIRYCGLADKPGRLTLYCPPASHAMEDATMCFIEGWEQIEVPVSTLDQELAELKEPIKLLKIDVEGMEHKILIGGINLLSAGRVKHILVEFNGYFLNQQSTSPKEMYEFLLSLGYFPLDGQTRHEFKPLENILFKLR